MQQTTVSRPVEFEGIGLHSGAPVRIQIFPAVADSGIRFRRVDLDGFEVPAKWEYVAKVSYATSLMRSGVLVSTTEHLLSAFYAMGIDNAVVELDNLEIPIMDGGAAPFVRGLQGAGMTRLDADKSWIRIEQPVEVSSDEKWIRIEPASAFEVEYETDFRHAVAGKQTLALTITPESYAREIAPARTFGFERDLAAMREMGLIRGATLENAVLYSEEGVRNPGGLRFPDEAVRHKLLDLIGDLALLGPPVMGRVKARFAGHALHAALVKKIRETPGCYRLTNAREAVAQPVG